MSQTRLLAYNVVIVANKKCIFTLNKLTNHSNHCIVRVSVRMFVYVYVCCIYIVYVVVVIALCIDYSRESSLQLVLLLVCI